MHCKKKEKKQGQLHLTGIPKQDVDEALAYGCPAWGFYITTHAGTVHTLPWFVPVVTLETCS